MSLAHKITFTDETTQKSFCGFASRHRGHDGRRERETGSVNRQFLENRHDEDRHGDCRLLLLHQAFGRDDALRERLRALHDLLQRKDRAEQRRDRAERAEMAAWRSCRSGRECSGKLLITFS